MCALKTAALLKGREINWWEMKLVGDCKILGLYKDLYKCKYFLWWGEEIWISGVLAWAWEESLPA